MLLCLSKWSEDIFKIAAWLERNILEYSSWYEDASIIKTLFSLYFLIDKIGLPIFPTVWTL